MKWIPILVLTAVGLGGFAGFGASPASAAPRLEIGQPFPELLLPTLEDGKPRSLADFRGRKVVLHVFASW